MRGRGQRTGGQGGHAEVVNLSAAGGHFCCVREKSSSGWSLQGQALRDRRYSGVYVPTVYKPSALERRLTLEGGSVCLWGSFSWDDEIPHRPSGLLGMKKRLLENIATLRGNQCVLSERDSKREFNSNVCHKEPSFTRNHVVRKQHRLINCTHS